MVKIGPEERLLNYPDGFYLCQSDSSHLGLYMENQVYEVRNGVLYRDGCPVGLNGLSAIWEPMSKINIEELV